MLRRTGCLLLVLTAGFAVEPVILENETVRASIDPHQGAVTLLVLKKAISFPYIADKGAGIAASGQLFAPVLWNGDQQIEIPLSLRTRSRDSITLAGVAAGIELTRILHLAEHSSSIMIEDSVRNLGGAAQMLRIGSASEKGREPWLVAERSWSGKLAQQIAEKDTPNSGEARSDFGWRIIGQYGVGFLYRVSPPPSTARFEQTGVRFDWKSEPLKLGPKEVSAVSSEVFVQEGSSGRSESAKGAVLIDADLAEAGTAGAPLRGFAHVIASKTEKVKVIVSQLGPSERAIISSEMTLQPGKERSIPFTLTPATKGTLEIEVAAFDGAGHKLVSSRAKAAIDQPGTRWDLYNRRMPEETYRGTWEQIGEQMARSSAKRIGSPTVERGKGSEHGKKLFAFYERRFPYYADMLRGAAKQLGGDPADIARLSLGEGPKDACMNVAFHGSDGAINAFSKERSGTNLTGLGYQKVIPSKGYPFHTYMMYGINSEGLSTSGATLNEDAATLREGTRLANDWKSAGKPAMPHSAAMWMLLSMCRTVDEALALIDSKDAPFEFTGNMLLLDRAGNAARVESAGMMHQIFRPNTGATGFFVAGNYPHQRPDGLFNIGARWGWAANTMMREKALWNAMGERHDKVSLDDVFSLMQTHGPGGMCQHIHDNAGLLYSSCSYIAITRTSDLWLADGPPCQVRYVRYRLQD